MLLRRLLPFFALCAVTACDPPYVVSTAPADVDPPLSPRAVSGGTLTILDGGKLAIAADPDRDVVWMADLTTGKHTGTVELEAGDEPGRVIAGPHDTAFVALRAGGAVVTFDTKTGDVLARTAVCPAPRGLALDEAKGDVLVACATGELVTMSADARAVTRSVRIAPDLRDVLLIDGEVWVSRFRAAELLHVDSHGSIASRVQLPEVSTQVDIDGSSPLFQPAVAWRTRVLPTGELFVMHQRGTTSVISIDVPDGYGGGSEPMSCSPGILHGAATIVDPKTGAMKTSTPIPHASLPVDVAFSSDGERVAVAAAGSMGLLIEEKDLMLTDDPCVSNLFPFEMQARPLAVGFDDRDQVVAFLADGSLWREAADAITFPAQRTYHPGHALFHTRASSTHAIACASCHPEGRDDGRVWDFDPIGPRRSQSVGGDITTTAPFHWDGDMDSMATLVNEVFVHRMGGSADEAQASALQAWLTTVPVLPRVALDDADSVKRGEKLFNDATVGCASCHAGEALTNNATVDVGTGKAFQVPSLRGVGSRGPWMHDGCATTLADRFSYSCGGGDAHGKTSQLNEGQIQDLVAYLETL